MPQRPASGSTMVVFFAGLFALVDHPFVLFLRSKCYGMVEREFFFVRVCCYVEYDKVVNCSIKRSSQTVCAPAGLKLP